MVDGPPDAPAALLDRVLRAAAAASVLVVGDVMLDEYVLGVVDRTSPEAPVPVLRVREQRASLGGAANVARQLVALGAGVRLVGQVGDDPAGLAVREACREAGIDAEELVVRADGPTTRKQRVVAGRQQLVRIDVEEVAPHPDHEVAALAARLAEGPRPDAVVVSDYAKGFVTDEVLRAVMALGRRWGVPVLVDPKSADFGRYRGAAVVKANRAEFEAAVGRSLGDRPEDELEADGQRLRTACGIDQLVVTLGERGLVVLDGSTRSTVASRSSDEVFDVSGAGDTVLALLALGLVAGAPLAEAAVLANVAAGLVVRRAGVAVVDPDDLRQHVHGARPAMHREPGELARRVARWQEQGRRVVFTNGCFDLLHPGHLHLLRSAAALGDVLVVGLNSDASVQAIKGPDRPVVAEDERAALVAAVRDVDAVVLFDEPDPGELIARLGPDVLVKGGDYALDAIVGREAVEARGGRVVTVPLLPGWSTSATIARIRAGRGDT